MAVARASVADIRPESLAVRAAWKPGHLRWLLTWQCREPATSRAGVAMLHLSTATGSTFVFGLRGPSKVISPSSRFKISSDSYYRYWFFFLVFGSARLPKLASAISSPSAWVTGRRNRQCGCSSFSSDFDYVCHCEGKCAERGTSSRNGCRRSCRHPPLLWHSHTTWQRLEDPRNALLVSCGDVQVGDRGRSKETLRAFACRRFSSSLPELRQKVHFWALQILLFIQRCDDGSSNRKKKKKRHTPLTTPRKRSFEGRCQRRKRDVLSRPQFGGG